MLFLRNIVSCSLHRIKDKDNDYQLIWQAKINNIDSCRDSRQKVIDSIDNAPIYQLDIERKNYSQNKKVSEIWVVCTGGHSNTKQKFEKFANEKRLKPRGGVASLLAQSYEKSLDKLRSESFPNPPELKGEIYSYLPLSIITNLGVHLNGNFSLSSARGILQFEDDFLQAHCDNAKWNKYILHDVLPDLHVKLLGRIVELENDSIKEANYNPHTTNDLWPIKKNTMGLYKEYGLNVIKKLGYDSLRIFWTKVSGGQFISLEAAKIFGEKDAKIAEISVSSGVSAVKLDKDKIGQLNEIVKSGNSSNFPYKPVTGESVCEMLHGIYNDANISYDSSYELLNFILPDLQDNEMLTGLPLVPLSNGSVGKFGETYYIGEKKTLKLFPNSISKFVSADLPEKLLKIFEDNDFSESTNIKKFDASAILEFLNGGAIRAIRPIREVNWEPNEKSISENILNNSWLKKIWAILSNVKENEFTRLLKFPLLPVIPFNKLIRLDPNNPILYIPESGQNLFPLFPVLVKLKVRFTNMEFPERTHKNLKKCIAECTPINIINSLKTLLNTNQNMKQLFEDSELLNSDYEKFRTFIKEELDTLTDHGRRQGNFMEILNSLPIWPIYSSEDKFIDAKSGNLLTSKLSFFSFCQDTKFYKYGHKTDYDALIKLGATPIEALDYLKKHIVPQITFLKPTQDYTTFLKEVLFLEDKGIEQFLKTCNLIPNKSLADFVKADTLYDISVPIFRSISTDDKILPSELQENPICLKALRRIGLKCQIFNIAIEPISMHDQNGKLFKTLLEFLRHGNKYHDVDFIVGIKKFSANRYVLSAASVHFKEMFCNSNELITSEIHVPEDIQPESIEVLLLWLYGQPFEDAKNSILSESTNPNSDHGYVSFLMSTLKVTYIYKVEKLKDIIENIIKMGRYIGVHDVCKILKRSKEFRAQNLIEFYEEHVRSNMEIFDEQLKLRENAANEELLQMFNPLFED